MHAYMEFELIKSNHYDENRTKMCTRMVVIRCTRIVLCFVYLICKPTELILPKLMPFNPWMFECYVRVYHHHLRKSIWPILFFQPFIAYLRFIYLNDRIWHAYQIRQPGWFTYDFGTIKMSRITYMALWQRCVCTSAWLYLKHRIMMFIVLSVVILWLLVVFQVHTHIFQFHQICTQTKYITAAVKSKNLSAKFCTM